jgi:transposase
MLEEEAMMELSYGHASFARCEKRHLTLHLSAELFGVERWEAVKAWFAVKTGALHWLTAPFQVMTAEEDVPDYPRWKHIRVDMLSWLIFHLPTNHALVKLWQVIDWTAINRLCAPIYKNSQSGQRAWAPAQVFALLLLYFVLLVPSECELLRVVAIVPLYRWFCGFGMFTRLPDHSTLYTFRKNVGEERFEAILSLVVLRCMAHGLVANDLVHFDMKGVSASARVWTPYERAVLLTQALMRYLEQTENDGLPATPLPEVLRHLAAEVAIEVLGNKRLQKNAQAPSRVLGSLERWMRQRQEAKGQALWEMRLEQAVHILLASQETACPVPETQAPRRRWLKEVAQRLKALLPHARGDSDARVGWVSDVALKCGYWLGFVVDGLHSIITAVSVVPLNVDQRTQMLPALDAHRQRVGDYPHAVAADSAQDYDPVHQGLDRRQIQGHIASRDRRTHSGGFGVAQFTFDEQGHLRCPAGKRLVAGKRGQKDGRTPFRAQGSDCVTCPLKAACLPKGQQPNGPRFIRLRIESHRRWLQNRAHTQTETYKEAQKKRFASEGLFGLAVRLHGADKMPYRSQPMNRIAGLLIGIAMNLAVLTHQATPA